MTSVLGKDLWRNTFILRRFDLLFKTIEVCCSLLLSMLIVNQIPSDILQVNILSDDDQQTSSESESQDDISVRITSKSRSDRRKHQRMWTVDEVVKLVDGISHFGVGKWTDIKNHFFQSVSHRTPIDIRVFHHSPQNQNSSFCSDWLVSQFFSSNLCRTNGVIYWKQVIPTSIKMERFVAFYLPLSTKNSYLENPL